MFNNDNYLYWYVCFFQMYEPPFPLSGKFFQTKFIFRFSVKAVGAVEFYAYHSDTHKPSYIQVLQPIPILYTPYRVRATMY